MKIINFLISRLKIAYWRLRGWEMMASDEIFEHRLTICEACEHRNAEKEECRLCGCPVVAKSVLASQRCPDKRWFSVKVKRETR